MKTENETAQSVKSAAASKAQDAGAKPYEPTSAEAETLKAYRAARAKRGSRLKVSGSDVSIDHPNPALGSILLLKTVGSTDGDFLQGLTTQLVNAGSQGSKADEHGINFMLAVVKGIEPRDQVEAMLAAQMAAVHMATMTFARRLAHIENIPQQDSASNAFKQASSHVRGPSRGTQAIPQRRRAEDDRSARPCSRRWAGDRRERQRSNPGGRGTQKNRGSTPCSWICTRRCDAAPNRSGAGSPADRRRCGAIASAGCMGPVVALPRATGTP
jgi:hypothetical protein